MEVLFVQTPSPPGEIIFLATKLGYMCQLTNYLFSCEYLFLGLGFFVREGGGCCKGWDQIVQTLVSAQDLVESLGQVALLDI